MECKKFSKCFHKRTTEIITTIELFRYDRKYLGGSKNCSLIYEYYLIVFY
jgi:hypothetical protein